jgi:exonuclease SbcC
MNAFGPFASTEVIDFRELGETSFFLIHGPTGAGKTTVLDAMCVALYGKTTGDERTAEQMRSGFASPGHPTSLRFDFAVGRDCYRVERIPRQTRPALRGEGLVNVPPEATLWRRTGLSDDNTPGEVLATGTSDVTEKVVKLLGFSAGQFRQVIMLPQGRFRELLSAGSRERQRILEELFDAELYGSFETFLKERKRTIGRRVDDLRLKIGEVLAVHEVEAAEQLQALLAETGEITAGLEREEAAAKQEAVRAQEAVDEARRIAALFEAEAVAREAAREAGEALAEAEAQATQAGAALAEERLRDPRREELQGRVRDLEALRAKVTALAATQKEHEAAGRAVEECAEALATAQGSCVHAEAEVARLEGEWREAQEAAQQAVVKSARVEREADTVKVRLAALRALAAVDADLRSAEEKALEAAALHERAADRVREAAASLDTLERTWREGQAALLAAALAEGEPCPICGSTHHPAPAHAEGELVTTEQVEEVRERLRELEEQEKASAVTKGQTHADAVALRARRTQIESGLVGQPGFEGAQGLQGDALTTAVKDLTEHQCHVEARLRDLGAAVTPPAPLEKALERARVGARDAGAAKDAAREALGKAESGQSRTAGILATQSAEVPEEYRRPGALEEALAAAVEEHGTLTEALESAREANEKAGQSLAAAKRSSTEAAARLTEAAAQVEELEPPDLGALEEAARDSGAARDAAVASAAASRRHAEAVAESFSRVASLNEELETAAAEFSWVALFSDAANRSSLSFQRYVLGVFLAEVLAAATTRLLQMTRGRYRLHAAAGPVDGRRAGGLDLEVFDEFTGEDRPVGTLSGGEGFMASLALALGLADVVQSFSGGIRLEAVFVDEGFGTLDPEALDAALDTLLALREHGRLVGVISHVPELRERIDCRLEVIPTSKGSTAQLVVPH